MVRILLSVIYTYEYMYDIDSRFVLIRVDPEVYRITREQQWKNYITVQVQQ